MASDSLVCKWNLIPYYGMHGDAVGRRPANDSQMRESAPGVIGVVARAFDVMRCFEDPQHKLANSEIAARSDLPRSTVSRLTNTLTQIGQLVYSPHEQRYALGPSAIAMSAAHLRGASERDIARTLIEQLANEIPGTIGLTCPDRFHMVYLDCARAYNAVALNSTVGTRISIARTAAGQAHAAALDQDAFHALAEALEQHDAAEAALLRKRVTANRRMLKQHGYVISSGLWNPHIAGLSTPVWSQRRQTWLSLVCGVLSAMYDNARLRSEVAPKMLACAAAIESLEKAPAAAGD